ncbi:MAG: hypothetical protein PVG26_11750 [Desulfobacterales bacterium]|jgi:hypothetical protein
MIWHPLLIAVVVGDVLSLLLWFGAAGTAFQITVKWAPQSTHREQIQLERKAETARLSAKFSLVIFIIASIVIIIGITNVLPAIVPGAMCGTGVLQATSGLGGQALIYRFLAFFIMMLWLSYEKLDLSRPDAPLTRYNSRLLLLALPFILLAVITTFRSILLFDSHQAVNCCAIVYDQFGNLAAARHIAGLPNAFWVRTFWMLTFLMLLCACWSLTTKRTNGKTAVGFLAVISIAWVPIAAITLVRVHAAYFYQVLHHHCPWCLFLPEHKFVGVPLFGLLIIISVEGPLSYLVARTAANFPDLVPKARRRSKLASLRLILSAIVYAGMVVSPAIYWKLIYGVWLE